MATDTVEMDKVVSTLRDLEMARASDVADWLGRLLALTRNRGFRAGSAA